MTPSDDYAVWFQGLLRDTMIYWENQKWAWLGTCPLTDQICLAYCLLVGRNGNSGKLMKDQQHVWINCDEILTVLSTEYLTQSGLKVVGEVEMVMPGRAPWVRLAVPIAALGGLPFQ